jgi:hypothetical protein
LVRERAGEQQQTNGEERADAPDRLEVCQVHEKDLAHREHQDSKATEPDRALAP